MNIWVYLYLAIQILAIVALAVNHGKTKEVNAIAATFWWLFVTLPILYMAGLFNA